MASRRTTRARAAESSATSAQPPITDHFAISRKASVLPSKDIVDESYEDSSSSAGPTPTRGAKRTLFNKKSTTLEDVPLVEVVPARASTARKKKELLLKPKKEVEVEERCSTPPPQPELKPQAQAEQAISPPGEPSAASTTTVQKKVPSKKKTFRSVAELQASLAARSGAGRALHEQTTARRATMAEADRLALLKSPMKRTATAQLLLPPPGLSPPKRTRQKSKGPVKVRPLPVPEYVLPEEKKKSEKKEEALLDEDDANAPTSTSYGISRLIPAVRASAKIELPSHYKKLLDLFGAVDQILSIFESTGRTATITTIQKDVQRVAKQPLTLGRIAQLISVFPAAWKVELKQLSGLAPAGDISGGAIASDKKYWHHVIQSNLNDDQDLNDFLAAPLPPPASVSDTTLRPPLTPSKLISPTKGHRNVSAAGVPRPSPRKNSSPVKPLPREWKPDERRRLEGWRLVARRAVFRHLLAQMVLAEHEKFIAELPGGSGKPAGQVTRLHPHFIGRIDVICPQIQEAAMEAPPDNEGVLRCEGVEDFLQRAEVEVGVLPKGVDTALAELRSPLKPSVSSTGVALSPAKFADRPKQPLTVMERIRAKEAARKLAEMQRNPEEEQRKKDCEALLSRHLRRLFSLYSSRGRCSLELSTVAEQLAYASDGGISKDAASSLLRRLADLAPAYCTLSQTSLGLFLKLVALDSRPKMEQFLQEELKKCSRA